MRKIWDRAGAQLDRAIELAVLTALQGDERVRRVEIPSFVRWRLRKHSPVQLPAGVPLGLTDLDQGGPQ